MNRLNIHDFTYHLSPEKIALFPLTKRDESKLLLYKQGKIEHTVFKNIVQQLPDNSSLFFNDTKVIPARLYFQKDTGATVEIFLLHPISPSALLIETMYSREHTTWQCTIGNLKRWTDGLELTKQVDDCLLRATLADREKGIVSFSWNGGKSFAEIVRISGETPLPPYLKREAQASDKERYQTVYANYEGAVAAPTAGLHFTPDILKALADKMILTDFLTLHVSAGTFQPVKSDDVTQHTMHQEQIVVTRNTIERLLLPDKFIVPVGTTSMRTLESLYWYGVKLLQNPEATFIIHQNDPYEIEASVSRSEAMRAILQKFDRSENDFLTGETSIFIMPGYTFRVCDGLITNFHQPGSTLILLVAAFIGEDWRRVYDTALNSEYRFLSYGDSSLLLPKR